MHVLHQSKSFSARSNNEVGKYESSDEAEDDKEEASEVTLLTIADSGGSTNFKQLSPESHKNEKDFDK